MRCTFDQTRCAYGQWRKSNNNSNLTLTLKLTLTLILTNANLTLLQVRWAIN